MSDCAASRRGRGHGRRLANSSATRRGGQKVYDEARKQGADLLELLANKGAALAEGLMDRVQHLVLPVAVLSSVLAAGWSRYLRGSMIETLDQPFVVAANKVDGIRAAMATSETIARYSREHNGTNVLTLGATLVSQEEARVIVTAWLTTPMREPRYIARLAKIRDLEG